VNGLAWLIATWFGCGRFPWGPGTVGSLAAILIAVLAHRTFETIRLPLFLAIILLLAPAIWASSRTARVSRLKDPGMVVVDEVLGQWTALLGTAAASWKSYTAAFLLFRLFDIWKPGPIRRLEQLPGGYGIMADDLAAGLLAALILYVVETWKVY
jgi:phosphatidylglycerophosphatase A